MITGSTVKRSLKGADSVGDTFKVPTYISYISARFLSVASISMFILALSAASCIEYQMARGESGESMAKMQNSPGRLGFELASRRKVEGWPRFLRKECESRAFHLPRTRPIAVANRDERLAKLRNITGKRRGGYSDREIGHFQPRLGRDIRHRRTAVGSPPLSEMS